ncbi:MAG: nuclear transport factor 2 family protein [Acidimicrobiia bacterium]
MSSDETRPVIDSLYEAYFAGDQRAMLALMSDDIEVRFLGQALVHGIDEARRFFAFSGARLTDLDFRIQRKIIDGEWAAVLWEETAVTADRKPWENHGVDVFRVVGGEIVLLHENNDVRLVHQHFPRYENGS